jgi:type VI secretion system protein VasG
MSHNLKSLIAKLNDPCRGALEGAAGLCLSQTHYEVDVEHLLAKLLERDNLDLHLILRHFEIDTSRLERDLTGALKGFKSGNTRTPVLSSRIPRLIERAWLVTSIDHGETRVRSGHLLLALLGDNELARLIRDSTRAFAEISFETLESRLDEITAGSAEASPATPAVGASVPGGTHPATGAARATPALDQYTIDLTERAREGAIDPVLGRDHEVRQMVDILTRRRQNNPILTGEAGVGKTAVVEGLALRIAAGDVPPPLRNVVLRTLDLGLLQAGASVRGEFENRLRSVIDEVKASPQPIVLFIDEAHTLIGAGGQAGQGDAANLLKPALARGELRTIAATTWSEYKKYFEKDAALARRFQVVKIDEPDEARAIVMLRGLADRMEQHHKVRVLDQAVVEAVKLGQRYLSGRQLPDKAVSVLDTACARVAMSQNAVPGAIEDLRRRIEALAGERSSLEREAATGSVHAERLAELTGDQQLAEGELAALEQRWQGELALVERARDLRARLEAEPTAPDDDREMLKSQLAEVSAELERVQGQRPLIHVCCNGSAVAEVISGWTGIPVGRMVKDEVATVIRLKSLLEERVIGQSHALEAIAQRIQTARASLEDPGKPIGVFLLVGTSGVGKTETALALAEILYGGERNLITINMSEFQEAHTVATLKGSPPGYIGYGEGGVLTEAVRRKPYSVVLLDEIEKAHPDVLELFFQVFDKGMLDDAEGREIDFKNTVILLTSNVGTGTIMRHCQAAGTTPEPEALLEALRPELQAAFKPAFLGRLVVIPYYPVKDEVLKRIVELKLGKVRRRVRENHRAELVFGADLVDAIAARCTEVDSGARNVDSILTGTLLPEVATHVLGRMAEGGALSRIRIGVGNDGAFSYDVG